MSYMVGVISSYYDTDIVMMAIVITVLRLLHGHRLLSAGQRSSFCFNNTTLSRLLDFYVFNCNVNKSTATKRLSKTSAQCYFSITDILL